MDVGLKEARLETQETEQHDNTAYEGGRNTLLVEGGQTANTRFERGPVRALQLSGSLRRHSWASPTTHNENMVAFRRRAGNKVEMSLVL